MRTTTITGLCALTLLTAIALPAEASRRDNEAYMACKNAVEARYGEDANVSLRRVRHRQGMTRVEVRVRGVEGAPGRLECRQGPDDGAIALFDPKARQVIAATP